MMGEDANDRFQKNTYTFIVTFPESIFQSTQEVRPGSSSDMPGGFEWDSTNNKSTKNLMTRSWQLKYFLFSPLFGEDEPHLTSIFFRWVGKKTPTRWGVSWTYGLHCWKHCFWLLRPYCRGLYLRGGGKVRRNIWESPANGKKLG